MWKHSKWLLIAVGLMTAPCPAGVENQIGDTRATLAKWVETRQLISRTKADWQADKETLEQSVKLFEQELQSVQEQMSKVSTNNTQVEKERTQTEALQKSSRESLERARDFATDFEGKLTGLVPQLPTPLQDILKPLLNRIPNAPAKTRMSAAERIQVIVGILNELDKFNNAVNLFSEKRTNSKGEEMAVEVVYAGLGGAYFVNESGDFAGTGTSGSSGWVWTVQPEIAPPVREVIQIYRNERPARFVALPISIH